MPYDKTEGLRPSVLRMRLNDRLVFRSVRLRSRRAGRGEVRRPRWHPMRHGEAVRHAREPGPQSPPPRRSRNRAALGTALRSVEARLGRPNHAEANGSAAIICPIVKISVRRAHE